ncbi:DUF2213 domain-containing protein [Bombella apis]|uniref:DUF2213 domain-containing protein n=1 Tax=Bombella apis TaxID=1785988 RepID=UPI0012B7675B|nr:DUF2213 domain-containing protein [Bombella apis]MPV99826.1 DUF2213 domain-containing protein [Bombella apis]
MPWITVHPVYEKGDGRHVLISDDGTIQAGMGGKFNGRKISSLHEKGSKGEGHKPSIKDGTQARIKEIKDDLEARNAKGFANRAESDQYKKDRSNSFHELDSLRSRLEDIDNLGKAGITDENHPTFQKVMQLRDEAERRYNDWRDSLSYEDLKDQILSKKWSNDAKRRAAWRDYYAQQEASNAKKDEFHKADAAVALANPGTEYDDDVQPLAEPLQAREHELTAPVSRRDRRNTRDTDHGTVSLENAQWHRAPRAHTGEGNYLIGLHPDEAKKLGVALREKGHAHDRAGGILAYDRTGSVRTFDDNGRLRVERTPISKANICEYLGKEIPDNERLGLNPKQMYRLLRDPKELEKAADSFNSLPVLEDHTPTSADAHPRELTVGSTMDNARFEAPYLTVGMVIFDGPAIQRIQSGAQRELSCGYAYEADMTPGTYEGQPYDGRMVNIRGNHVALVERGRAGSDVLVHDSATTKENKMDMNKKTTCDGDGLEPVIEALRPFMGDLSDDAIRAKASALIDEGNRETDKPGGEDEDEDETEQHDDRLTKMEEFMRQEGFTAAQASKCREMCAEMLKGGAEDDGEEVTGPNSGAPSDAEDEDDEEEKERRREMATDAAIRKALAADRALRRATEDARNLVRPLVGEVYGMDSAAQVYRYALRQSGMAMDSVKGVNEAGLKALVNAQLRSIRANYDRPLAHDSAALPFKAPRQL